MYKNEGEKMKLIRIIKDKILSIIELIFYFACIVLLLFTWGLIILIVVIASLIVRFAPVWITILIIILIYYFS